MGSCGSKQSSADENPTKNHTSVTQYLHDDVANIVEKVFKVWESPDLGATNGDAAKVLSPKVANSAKAKAAELILVELVAWEKHFKKLLKTKSFSVKFDGFDKPTLGALETMGCVPKEIGGNSGAYWGEDGAIKKFRDRTLAAFVTACDGYEPTDQQDDEAKYVIMGNLVRIMFQCHCGHNIGAVPMKGMKDKDGKPILLIRCQSMADVQKENSAFRKLLELGVVRHAYNLYNGHFPIMDFIDMESSICAELRKENDSHLPTHIDERENASTRKWRRMVDEPHEWEDPLRIRNAMKLCAEQIRDILKPHGNAPEGGILIHCAGGMHRTGMIVGVIRRFINDDPIEDIIDDYKRHVDWKSNDQPGGYEELNVRFIKEFDMGLLDEAMKGSVTFDKTDEREEHLTESELSNSRPLQSVKQAGLYG